MEDFNNLLKRRNEVKAVVNIYEREAKHARITLNTIEGALLSAKDELADIEDKMGRMRNEQTLAQVQVPM